MIDSQHDGATPSFLSGGGEMGARMRAIDWSRTALGAAEQWPQSLKTAVRIMLTSRQPMFVWWGDQLINLYNDAYKSIVGGKHPVALGQPASIVWREIWPLIEPRAASAMKRNEGTYDEAMLLIMERNGYQEETYYTFSYSPVPADQGEPGGIICANTEDTRRIVGERQVLLLRELASRTTDARTYEQACARCAEALSTNPRDLPFALIYLVDPSTKSPLLSASTGIDPQTVDAAHWPVDQVVATNQVQLVDDLSGKLRGLLPGVWPRAPHRAVAVPIAPSGQTGKSGVLIVGLNPFRLYDDDYRGFIELVAAQIAASIGNAQAYEEERRRAETLAALDRAKTAFFSNVSHEFRTPLTLMLGPTEDALSQETPSLSGESLRTVHRNELRLLKLVNALLDFSRLEAGRAQASYRPTDVSALTRDLTSSFRSAIERAGIAFEVRTPVLTEPIFVDHEMWEKIVLNLLSNALKFTFEGAIHVELRELECAVQLSVRDTGTGIPAHEMPHLFERFYRVQGARSRTHEGSGIGLALVHELVRMHGGSIKVESAVDRGTTFTISLPRGSAHLPQDRVEHTQGAVTTFEAVSRSARPYVEEALRWLPGPQTEEPLEGGAARVLLADDNADMRDYVTRVLSQRWRVEAVADGVQALARARANPPDLIITDVMMPNLDGFGLLRELRAEPSLRELPVIMLSARAGEESRVEGLEAGADDYLPKPFSARELIARVQTHLQLSRLRVRMQALFTQAPVAIAILSGPEHRFELANPSFCEMVGRQAIIGKTMAEVFPEQRGSRSWEILDEAFVKQEPVRVNELAVPLIRNGEQKEAYFTYALEPMRDGAGEMVGLICVAIEVTEQVQAKRRMEILRSSAEHANRAKDEFMAMLGHELRNPLAPIATALNLMRLRSNGTLERERAVIERQVAHLGRLVDDLLDISRITRGKVALEQKHVELGEVIAKAIETTSPLLEQRFHRLSVSAAPTPVWVEGDPTRLAQVVANLLTNAAKYTEPGGRIEIKSRVEGSDAIIEVEDSGIGISPEMLPRVFDLFAQESQSLDRSQGGLGLGLSIVKNLVVMHGGRVEAESAGRGQGSTFRVRLPRCTPPVAPHLEMVRGDDHSSGVPAARRVLVVDDNQDAALLLADLLASLGWSTEVAHDGPSALQVAEQFHPDIALLDIGLPVMDGFELAERMRRLPGMTGLRLVAVTGYGQESDRARTRAAGFDAHLVKPVKMNELTNYLETFREPAAAAR